MSHADLDLPSEAAVAAYVDALYNGATEFVAHYAAVTAWLAHHPGTLVDEARHVIARLVGATPVTHNVVSFQRQI